ncbi:MAG: hypothetical protein ACLP19_05840 [Xanthobacteraceae bacterium]
MTTDPQISMIGALLAATGKAALVVAVIVVVGVLGGALLHLVLR